MLTGRLFTRRNSSDVFFSGDLIPFENLETTARDLSANFTDFTYRNLREGWERDKFRIPSVLPPVDWAAHNRSFSYHLHAWDAIADLLMGFDRLKDQDFFDASLAHARSWLQEFQVPLIGKDSVRELDALVRPTMPVEWYDMAVGLRVYRIAYILDVLLRTGGAQDDIDLFFAGLRFHLKLLGQDHFFRVHSNHGLYQALGHLAAARRFRHLPGFEAEVEIGRQRFAAVLEAHFSLEGPHLEHSPGYHFMLLGTLINARRSGLMDSAEAMMSKIEQAFAWMVGPDWRISTFGDTDPRGMVRQLKTAKLFLEPTAAYIISGGNLGSMPQVGVMAYLKSGYAFVRLFEPGIEAKFGNDSYLAQTAAFHSRVHKHADHLSIIWYDKGRDVLIDPGRYAYAGRTETGSDLFNQGYWYADPKRIYVESTCAHNCIEIDDKSYPRRSVKPWGSALRYAGEQNGMAITDCDLVHERSIRHRRVVIMRPGHFLLVLDWLNDRTSHKYTQWFQLAPVWSALHQGDRIVANAPAIEQRKEQSRVETGSGLMITVPGYAARPEETLSIFNLIEDNFLAPPIRGQEEPRLQGWMSDAAYSLIPTTSLAVEATQRAMGRFATLFVFGEDVEVDRGMTRFNATLRAGQIGWSDAKGRHRLHIALGEPGSVQAGLR